MKKYFLFLPFLLLCGTRMYGQSIKFTDLILFSNLDNGGVYNYLKQGTAFKQDYSQNMNGVEMEYFKNAGQKPNSERIITGSFTKLYNGTILRTVDYTSTDVQNVLNMISQAKRYGLDLQFQGEDNANSIFLFDSSFYLVTISIRRDQSEGMVEVKQKAYFDME